MNTKLFRMFPIILLVAVLCLGATPAHAAKIRVVTTLTDLADFAGAVGGDLVEVHSLATGVEDTHGVPMKPSFVPMLNRADLLILVGLDCEHAFLPALLEASKNPRIQSGMPGYVDCSKGIVPRDVPASTEHSAGDVHPYGNPHYLLDPVSAKTAIANIYDALVAFAPQHKAEFTRNRDAYLAKLNAKIAEWEKAVKPLQGNEVRFLSRALAILRGSLRPDLFQHDRTEAGHRSDPSPYRGIDHRDEGRSCSYRRAGTAISGKGAETHRRTNRCDPDNASHHAGRQCHIRKRTSR